MSEKSELSVVIVTWNSGNEICGCLNSVISSAGSRNIKIIVVDNNSSDNTIELVEDIIRNNLIPIKLIINDENKGFTYACNQAMDIYSAENILLLNPDARIHRDSLIKLSDKLNSNDKIGAIAPKLLNDDGSIQRSCRRFPKYSDMFFEMTLLSAIFSKSQRFNRWKMVDFSHDKESEVEQPMGAALMIKSSVLDKTGNFDEDFKMFFNDVDLCKRITEKGYKILFFPEAVFYHSKGVSIYKDRIRMIKTWNSDCLKYFRKHNYNLILFNLLALCLKITGILRILYYKITK
ncbi:MAG: N-acetylglucosaminyl-diphospho-decaprenol L-rhamnosyltransferase [Ignavibacteria bacterium]|nr:N-acetylglucosaminyl-diphospho-decaprenol L-rhamnosyltransferase [Ignavibacteria bacterium]